MIQKVLKVGSSVAVTIPKKALKDLGISAGDEVSVTVSPAYGGQVIIQSQKAKETETLSVTDKLIEKYRPALDSLAKK